MNRVVHMNPHIIAEHDGNDFRPRFDKNAAESNKELMDKQVGSKSLYASLSVSTPWTEVTDSYLDENVARTVDIVIQMLRHILWYSTFDQPPWKVSAMNMHASR